MAAQIVLTAGRILAKQLIKPAGKKLFKQFKSFRGDVKKISKKLSKEVKDNAKKTKKSKIPTKNIGRLSKNNSSNQNNNSASENTMKWSTSPMAFEKGLKELQKLEPKKREKLTKKETDLLKLQLSKNQNDRKIIASAEAIMKAFTNSETKGFKSLSDGKDEDPSGAERVAVKKAENLKRIFQNEILSVLDDIAEREKEKNEHLESIADIITDGETEDSITEEDEKKQKEKWYLKQYSLMSYLKDSIVQIAKDRSENLKTMVNEGKLGLKNKVKMGILGALVLGAIYSLEHILDGIGNMFTWFENLYDDIFDHPKGVVGYFTELIGGLLGKGADYISGLWNKLQADVDEQGGWINYFIMKQVNGAKTLINWISKDVFGVEDAFTKLITWFTEVDKVGTWNYIIGVLDDPKNWVATVEWISTAIHKILKSGFLAADTVLNWLFGSNYQLMKEYLIEKFIPWWTTIEAHGGFINYISDKIKDWWDESIKDWLGMGSFNFKTDEERKEYNASIEAKRVKLADTAEKAYKRNIVAILEKEEKDQKAYDKRREKNGFKPVKDQEKSGNKTINYLNTSSSLVKNYKEGSKNRATYEGKNAQSWMEVITSQYGVKEKTRNFQGHSGTDFRTGKEPVKITAIAPGIVEKHQTDLTKAGGNVLVVRNYDGKRVLYMHLSKFLVKKGDVIQPGDAIAMSGNTGATRDGSVMPPHIHIAVKDGRTKESEDPLSYINSLSVSSSTANNEITKQQVRVSSTSNITPGNYNRDKEISHLSDSINNTNEQLKKRTTPVNEGTFFGSEVNVNIT